MSWRIFRALTVEHGAVRAGREVPVGVGLDRLHEASVTRNRVVWRSGTGSSSSRAGQRHVVAGRLEHARLLLLARLAPDELLDVEVVDVEHDHLRGAPRLPPDLIVPAEASAPRMKLTGPLA